VFVVDSRAISCFSFVLLRSMLPRIAIVDLNSPKVASVDA
jgi:hypothetical protein